jgi:NADH:ubiquinone oxidoreductase subunit 5 (subunit L)/multisubunit Na+/H+ antiporter MnhA subunit
MKTLKAIYNFIVGDMIILVGILIVAIALGLISNIDALAALRPAIGPVLIVAALVVLSATLYREARGNR